MKNKNYSYKPYSYKPYREKRNAHLILVFLIGFLIGFSFYIIYPQKIVETRFVDRNVTTNITPLQITSPVQASSNVVAVSSEGEGLLGVAVVEIIPGRGRVLISTNPFIEPDTQYSVEQAKSAVEKLTGKSLAESDIIVGFNLSVNGVSAQVVGGPSAGASIASAIAAAIQGKQTRSDAVITGTIDENGFIGQIGGVLEKAEASGKAEMKIFLVPDGQGSMTYYEKEIERKEVSPGFVIQRIRYVPKTIDLNNYTQQWNMTTIEVTNLEEAMRYMIE